MTLGLITVVPGHPAYNKAKSYLTFDVFDVGTQTSTEFCAYSQYHGGGIGIPRDYARKLGIDPAPDKVAFGYEIPDGVMKPIKLRKEQEPFVDELEAIAMETITGRTACSDIRAEAATGKGKTVMSLELCRRLQMTMLVVVDQDFLRDQWIERATDPNLFGMPRSEIGVVQGKTEDWQDKSIVVGMIQTLYNREMSESFWNYFGVVVFDESHVMGAKQFSRIMGRIPAAIRLGVSATSERKDELERVLDASLGPVRVILGTKHAASAVRYVTYTGNCYSWYANSSGKAGRYISEMAEDGLRTFLICRIIKSMYSGDRHILGVSDRIEHVEDAAALLVAMGVPREDIGVIATDYTTYRYAKDDRPKRIPEGWVRGTPYTPIKLQRVRKRNKAEDLRAAKEARIILATYGKFEKGVDIPRLDAGIDMTPRSKAQQLHGRILREMKGKQTPVWVTIRDSMSYRAEHQFAVRVTEYVKSNAEVYKWVLGKSPVRVDTGKLAAEAHRNARRLKKEGEITTKPDGNYTVQMRSTVTGSRRVPAKRTAGTTRRGTTSSLLGNRSRRRA